MHKASHRGHKGRSALSDNRFFDLIWASRRVRMSLCVVCVDEVRLGGVDCVDVTVLGENLDSCEECGR